MMLIYKNKNEYTETTSLSRQTYVVAEVVDVLLKKQKHSFSVNQWNKQKNTYVDEVLVDEVEVELVLDVLLVLVDDVLVEDVDVLRNDYFRV